MKNKRIILCVLGILMLLMCETVFVRTTAYASQGRTYYVSVNGNDKANGTLSRPFKTINRGIKALRAGDTLIIRKGTYREKVSIPSSVKGKRDSEITIRSEKNERVIISGRNMKSPVLMRIEGAKYINISGLEFANARGQDACAIYVGPGTSNFQIKDNRIYNISVPNPKKPDSCANCIILFGDSAKSSIKNGTISENSIYNCKTGWAECISVTANVKNISISNNYISNTGNIGIDVSGNYGYCSSPSRDFPRNIEITGNTVTKCISPNATSYGIYVDGGQNVTISDNMVTKCSGGIEIGAERKPSLYKYSTKNIKVKNNVIRNNIENGVTVGGYKKNLGWVLNVTIEKNRILSNNTEITLAKCNKVKIRKNKFLTNLKESQIIDYALGRKYVKNMVFIK